MHANTVNVMEWEFFQIISKAKPLCNKNRIDCKKWESSQDSYFHQQQMSIPSKSVFNTQFWIEKITKLAVKKLKWGKS